MLEKSGVYTATFYDDMYCVNIMRLQEYVYSVHCGRP